MWIFLSVVFICLTALILSRVATNLVRWLPNMHFNPRLVVELPDPAGQAGEPDGTEELVPYMPDEITRFIAGESSPHAQEDLRAEAVSLFSMNHNWDQTLNLLQQRYGVEDD